MSEVKLNQNICKAEDKKRILTFASVFSNAGFIAIPLITAFSLIII